MPSIKGTASVTDNRALNKRLASVKFPANFTQKFDVESVNRVIMTQWIEQKVTELLGLEDEIVQSTAVNLFLPTRIEDGPKVEVNPKKAQIDLEGFLGEEKAAEFAAETWELLLDAQSSGVGVPKKLVEEKKRELESQRAQAPVAASHQRAFRHERDDHHGGRRRGPPPEQQYQFDQNNRYPRGPPPPPPPRGPRRSVSPERRPGGRDEFGRSSRPDSSYYHGRDERGDGRRPQPPPVPPYEIDRRGARDYDRRGYDRRSSPSSYHRRGDDHHHRRPHARDDRHRYEHHHPGEPDSTGAPRGSSARPPAGRRHSRSRSRSPPPPPPPSSSSRRDTRRRHRSRSASSSSSSASSSQSSVSGASSHSGHRRHRGSR